MGEERANHQLPTTTQETDFRTYWSLSRRLVGAKTATHPHGNIEDSCGIQEALLPGEKQHLSRHYDPEARQPANAVLGGLNDDDDVLESVVRSNESIKGNTYDIISIHLTVNSLLSPSIGIVMAVVVKEHVQPARSGHFP